MKSIKQELNDIQKAIDKAMASAEVEIVLHEESNTTIIYYGDRVVCCVSGVDWNAL